MKEIMLIGRQNIIDPNTGKTYDDAELCALDGIKKAIIKLSDDDNLNDEIVKFLDRNPDWEGYKIEVIPLNR